jgi:hypothetical protein
VAIFYSFLSSAKLDTKIDELRQTMHTFTTGIHEHEEIFEKLKKNAESLKQFGSAEDDAKLTVISWHRSLLHRPD